jgi:hypothetical protein
VDKIFKGANPADLPAEQPTKFDQLNVKGSCVRRDGSCPAIVNPSKSP